MQNYIFNCKHCELGFAVQVATCWLSYRRCPQCGSPVVEQPEGERIDQSLKSIRDTHRTSNVGISGTKYLYLAEAAHSRTWIEGGGPVPIRLASTYLSDRREGTSTPDENLIHRSPVDMASLRPAIYFENVKDITMLSCVINGAPVPDIRNADFYREDGLVLCFSNTLSTEICRRLSKKVCVAIDDLASLKLVLDAQIGVTSTARKCDYTNNHERNHFLKHDADAWMDEYRLFWPALKDASVTLPKGMARRCELT
jgi:hypothetical protein